MYSGGGNSSGKQSQRGSFMRSQANMVGSSLYRRLFRVFFRFTIFLMWFL